MSQRVLATDRAKSAAQQMNSLLTGSLRSQLAALKQQGQTLCRPAVWDGPAAARFRSQQWPPMGRSMDQALEALTNLEKSSQTVTSNIIRAGSQGSIGGTITGVPPGGTVHNVGDTVVAAATGGAPPEPFLGPAIGWSRVEGAVSHFLGQAGHDVLHGTETAAADTVNFLASVGNAVLHDPGALSEVVGGLALTGVSEAGLGIGIAMDATGVGALAGGAELTGLSAVGLVTGVGLAGHGAGAIARDAAGPDRVTIMKAGSGSGTGSGSNPADGSWLSQAARDKVPTEWGDGGPTTKGVGQRWTDPGNQGNGIRIDRGNPNSPFLSQQEDHVVVRSGGRILDPDGKPITGTLAQNPAAHIPLQDWLKWRSWNAP